MLRKFLVTVVMVLGFCGQAAAEGYFGVNYSMVDLDGAKPTALEVKFGSLTSEYSGFEARIGIPMQSDEENFTGLGIEFEEQHLGAFGRFGAGSGSTTFYGLVGFMNVDVEGSLGGASESASDSGLAFGFGLEAGEDSGFAIEYLMGNGDIEDITWLNLGFFNRFE
jgi:hypothetical protein